MQASSQVQTQTFPSRFGKYTLLGRLGVGGMAEVLLAQQDVMGAPRLVAVKRLHPSLSEEAGAREMFLDEMKIVAGMRHPNIGHVIDVGEIEGTLFLAMEHIEGRDLRRILSQLKRRHDRLPLEMAVEIGRQVCAALDHAHTRTTPGGKALEIVHRDVTPDNVIVTFDGGVKVVDFGIARANDRISKTRTGLLKGTPAFMAPEQIQGQPVDGRADVFSLGALLYQITTGEHPFGDASGAGVLLRVIDVTPKSPSEILPDFPEDLERAILGALEKDPDARWPDAASFAETLDAVVARKAWLVSPGRMSRWITELFPDAAKARADLAADPNRTDAARAANYMGKTDDESGPLLPDLEALKAQLGDGEDGATQQVSAEMLWGRSEDGDAASDSPEGEAVPYVPAGLDLPAPAAARETTATAVTPPPSPPTPPASAPPPFPTSPPSSASPPTPTAPASPPAAAPDAPPLDPLGAAHMDDAAGEIPGPGKSAAVSRDSVPTNATRPAHRKTPEARSVKAESGEVEIPEAPSSPAIAPQAPAPPVSPETASAASPESASADAAAEVWSLAEHWDHLPPAFRASWVVALGGAAAGLAVLLMGIGLVTLIGWLR